MVFSFHLLPVMFREKTDSNVVIFYTILVPRDPTRPCEGDIEFLRHSNPWRNEKADPPTHTHFLYKLRLTSWPLLNGLCGSVGTCPTC